MHPSIYHTKSLLHRHKFVLYPAETCSSSLARRTNTHEPRCPFCPGWILLAGWSCVGPAGPLSKGGTSYIHILLCISDTASSGVFPGAPATLDRVNANQLCGGGYTVQIEEPLHLQSIPASNPGVFLLSREEKRKSVSVFPLISSVLAIFDSEHARAESAVHLPPVQVGQVKRSSSRRFSTDSRPI